MTLPKYFATFNEHVEKLVPAHAARVLDVGCGAGLFLERLKADRGGNLTVEGVEPDAFAALAARQRLDAVFEGTAEAVAPRLEDGAYRLPRRILPP